MPVVFWSAWIFFSGAFRALRARTLDMMVAVGAGWVYSVIVTLTGGGEVFYEAATVLSAFVLLGHWFEMRARGGANEAIRALLDLAPAKAVDLRDGLGWAIGCNAIALPIAAGVFEPAFGLVLRPEIAALSMSGSSFIVAVNALWLKRLHLAEAGYTRPHRRSSRRYPRLAGDRRGAVGGPVHRSASQLGGADPAASAERLPDAPIGSTWCRD